MTKVQLKARTAKARALVTALKGLGLSVQRPSGEAITHTESLDVLARLDGFQSHSHFMAQSKKQPEGKKASAPAAAPKAAPAKPANSITAVEVVQQWLDEGNVSKRFPREDWLYEVNGGNTKRTYPQWLLSQHDLHREFDSQPNSIADSLARDFSTVADICQEGTVFTPAAPIRLDTGSGTKTMWQLECYLTDRWGEVIKSYRNESKPSFVKLLLEDLDGYEYLFDRMADETCFIAAKEGKLGILVEMELCSIESETREGQETSPALQPLAEMRKAVLEKLDAADLKGRFPYLDFGLAFDEDFESYGRTGLLGFVTLEDMRKHALTLEDMSKVSDALWAISA